MVQTVPERREAHRLTYRKRWKLAAGSLASLVVQADGGEAMEAHDGELDVVGKVVQADGGEVMPVAPERR